jgi:hypothetical protein
VNPCSSSARFIKRLSICNASFLCSVRADPRRAFQMHFGRRPSLLESVLQIR